MKLISILLLVVVGALLCGYLRDHSVADLPGMSQLENFTGSKAVNDLVSRSAKYLLIVDGDEGMGSASIIKWKGNALIVTNIHVVSGNANPRFRLLNGQELRPDTLGVPGDRDILVASQRQVKEGLEASTAVDSEVSIGDEVVILGNSLGSDVVTKIRGKVLGIGPDLIETDAKFVHGNSGSPIVHVKTGKVIAIATFATVRKVDELSRDSQFNQVRRFGYRIDTIPKWQFVTAKTFAAESGLMAEIHQRNDDLFALAKEVIRNKRVVASHYNQAGWVGDVVTALSTSGERTGVGGLKYQKAMSALRERIGDDIAQAQSRSLIPYHQKVLKDEIKTRTELARFFDSVNWAAIDFNE